MQLARQEFPAEVPELVGTYLESARLLGLPDRRPAPGAGGGREQSGLCP